MEDRREWVIARAKEIAGELGFDPPPEVALVAGEPPAPAIRFDTQIYLPNRPAGHERILISERALGFIEEKELIYRLVYACMYHKQDINRFARTAIWVGCLPVVLVFGTIFFLAIKVSILWLCALPLGVLLVPLIWFFIFPSVVAEEKRAHLKTIEFTCDTRSGLAMIANPSGVRTTKNYRPGQLYRMVAEEISKRSLP